MTYLGYLQRLSRINPTDYQDPGTQAHLTAAAAPLDDLILKARTVMLARLALTAPEDALLLIGAERGLRRYPEEPLAVYRTRVLDAWRYWQEAGTVPGMLAALKAAGYQAVLIEHFQDPDPVRLAEFTVIVGPLQVLKPDATWGGGAKWGQANKWGFQLPAVPLGSLVDLIREVKPAHARLRRLIWSPRGRYWGGRAIWGEGRPAPQAPPGWGLHTGYEGAPIAEVTDTGTLWGGVENELIYEMEGADAQNDYR